MGLVWGIIKGIGGGFFNYLNDRGERQLTKEIAYQNRMADDWSDNLIVILFVYLILLYFTPWTRETATLGFQALNETMPQSFLDNWHIIIASIFTVDGVKYAVKNYNKAAERKLKQQAINANTTDLVNDKPKREF